MPAVVTQKDSRAGLITAIVVLSIFFVVATIYAFYYNAEWRQNTKAFDNYKTRYNDIVSEASLNGAEVQEMQTLRNNPNSGFNGSMKVFDVAMAQRGQLVKMVSGSDSSTVAVAMDLAGKKLADAEAKAKAANVALPSAADNLSGAVAALADAVAAKQAEIARLNQEVTDAKNEVAAVTKIKDETLAKNNQTVEDVRKEAQQATEDAAKDRAAKQAQMDDAQKQIQDAAKASTDALAKKDIELRDKINELKNLTQQLNVTRAKFEKMRVNVNEPTIRQADGAISRVTGSNICYINRGQGDQITPGLTFEVYDKREGIPPLGDPTSDTLPVGKASIEVLHVGPTSSECRIVQQRIGAALAEGDLIANLVYDPNTKYNFVVYGKFDLDQNGIATVQEADVAKRLITQWGGKVTDKISVDVDFVVLGKEPQLPNFSTDELQDPINKKKLDDAQAELDAYTDVRNQARDLHIPILNQNRFLYFIGYYDLARK